MILVLIYHSLNRKQFHLLFNADKGLKWIIERIQNLLSLRNSIGKTLKSINNKSELKC